MLSLLETVGSALRWRAARVRRLSKRIIERGLRLANRNRPAPSGSLVLAYHNVVPDREVGKGEVSLHLSLTRFRRQLDLLQRYCRVVPLSAVLNGPEQDPGTVAVTFDDAYRGAVEHAAPLLLERGFPFTLFVSPGLLGTEGFWWDVIAEPGNGLRGTERQTALEQCHGRSIEVLARFPQRERLPQSYWCADVDQLRALARHPGVTLGAHTWSHAALPTLDQGDLAAELERPKAWLSEMPNAIPVLSYPYGLTSVPVRDAVTRAGYEFGLLIEGGRYAGGGDRFAIPRFNVPAGLSEDGLWLRLMEVVPA